MKGKGFDVILVSADGPDWASIPHLDDYAVYKIGMARQIHLWKDLMALVALIRLFRRVKPDIVHSHTPKAGLLGMLAAKFAGVPVRIHTVAGLPLMERTGLTRRILVLAEKLTYWASDKVYPNSFRLKDFIAGCGMTRPTKLKVIAQGSSNGIDAGHFSRTPELEAAAAAWRSDRGIAPESLVFVFVGRIVRDKGIHELLAAFDRLPGEATLVLVGPFEAQLDPIDATGLDLIKNHPRIIHVGFQKDVRPFLCAADVLVFPSYREGFPNVPMQAGCFGLPSIVTDINGCNEIIEEGINGLIVPPKDEQALEKAMERMITDAPLRAHCAAAARGRILEKYQQSVVWEALYQEYRQLLDTKDTYE